LPPFWTLGHTRDALSRVQTATNLTSTRHACGQDPNGRLTSDATCSGSSPICAQDAYGTLQTSGIYPGYDTTFRYAGQYTDSESGLQHLQARYYDPSSSQFLTVDPLAAQTGEPYVYSQAIAAVCGGHSPGSSFWKHLPGYLYELVQRGRNA
jgi:RHS repeat-associated protein